MASNTLHHAFGTFAPKFGSIHASVSHSQAEKLSLSRKRSDEISLTLLRHGESMWNEKGLFTGCVDVALTEKGVEEALEAGKRISSIPVDVIYTSSLIRAQMTAVIAMTQHRCKKVPVILHDETEEARRWSEINSEEARKQSVSVITAWQLNERMYGELQGFNKQETAERLEKELVHAWRRTYASIPPNGESLEMCAGRTVSYFREHIEPQLVRGNNLLVTAHANSLRSIVMYLDKLTAEEVSIVPSEILIMLLDEVLLHAQENTPLRQVIGLEMLTGVPMLYIFKDGRFVRRGSPTGAAETGVYAYSSGLALYRQKLDETPD